jgi:hypothetical protein
LAKYACILRFLAGIIRKTGILRNMSPLNKAQRGSNSGILSFSFEKARLHHEKMIFEWLAEPHMQEFWDNSQAKRLAPLPERWQ